MKTLQIEIPEELARELDQVVRRGFFHSADEIVRHALREFIQIRRLELLEEYQREDIAWALGEKSDK